MSRSMRVARRRGRSFAHLATRLIHTPLLMHPDKLEIIMAVFGLQPHSPGGPSVFFDDDDDEDGYELEGGHDTEPDSPVTPDVLVIPVHGSLVKRSSWMDADSGLCSYASIERQMRAAMDDPSCTGVVLDIDSGGGEAAGMFDLSDVIYSMRGQKPIVSIANDAAFSAAYCLGSCADKMLVTSVGGVGSIGCWMLHCDQSKFDEKIGVKYTYIYAGSKKVDGNPHESMSDTARAEWQQQCDRVRSMFVQTVAKNRGVPAEELLATEAGCFPASESIPMLADGVGTLQDAVNLCREMAGGTASRSMPIVASRKSARVKANAAKPIDVELERRTIAEMFSTFRSPNSAGWVDYEFQGGQILALRKFGTAALAPSGDVATQAKVSGVLAPYGSLSCDLGGFKEIFEPGCFSEALKTGDERVLYNHNIDNVLGRKSAGTARFWDEPDGLHYEADLPDTQAARDLRASMERGDIRESSAAFYILSHRWETRSGWRTRIIEKAKLVEGSPHSFAAYDSTTAKSDPVQPGAAVDSPADYELELIRARHELLMLA